MQARWAFAGVLLLLLFVRRDQLRVLLLDPAALLALIGGG